MAFGGETDHLEDQDVEGRAISNGYSRNKIGHGLDWSGSGQGHVAGCWECSNEPSGSIMC